MDQQQFQELSHDEKEEYRAQFKSQTSNDGGVKEEHAGVGLLQEMEIRKEVYDKGSPRKDME